jgi:hypothetical protein
MIASILSKYRAMGLALGSYNSAIRMERDCGNRKVIPVPLPVHYVPSGAKVVVMGGNTFTSWEANSHNNTNSKLPDGEHILYIKQEFAPR